jgi:hypothetical protein
MRLHYADGQLMEAWPSINKVPKQEHIVNYLRGCLGVRTPSSELYEKSLAASGCPDFPTFVGFLRDMAYENFIKMDLLPPKGDPKPEGDPVSWIPDPKAAPR